MAEYKVLQYFTDLYDNEHPYNVGDTYPRKGYVPTEKRINELSGDSNRRHIPLIEKKEKAADDGNKNSNRRFARGNRRRTDN